MLEQVIVFLILGALAGWMAGVLVKGYGFGLAADILVGIIGAFVGGFVFSLLGIATFGFVGQLVMAIVGAVLFLIIVKALKRTAEV